LTYLPGSRPEEEPIQPRALLRGLREYVGKAQVRPWAMRAWATFVKPAMLAPFR
jgi:hypothetical protein